MAYDFANSPTTNQTVTNGGVSYRWDGNKWAAASGGVASAAFVGDVPPVTPTAGQLWWESDAGLLFIWYNDGTSSQWVPATTGVSSGRVIVTTAGSRSVTGVTAETNLAALRIPGGAMGPNGTAEITAVYSYTNSANNKTIINRISATSGQTSGVTQLGASVATTTAAAQAKWIIRNNNATNSQLTHSSTPVAPYSAVASAPIASSIDTTNDWYSNLNGILANAGETLTLLHAMLTIQYAP